MTGPTPAHTAENDAGCACDPTDAALAVVPWDHPDGTSRATCALCGATRVIAPAEREHGDGCRTEHTWNEHDCTCRPCVIPPGSTGEATR